MASGPQPVNELFVTGPWWLKYRYCEQAFVILYGNLLLPQHHKCMIGKLISLNSGINQNYDSWQLKVKLKVLHYRLFDVRLMSFSVSLD